ncbi:MAG: hypothetical protein K2J08_03095, partial [Ruminococcus sp.]|nr:hypothetical protein [Ruminococcus sp.]
MGEQGEQAFTIKLKKIEENKKQRLQNGNKKVKKSTFSNFYKKLLVHLVHLFQFFPKNRLVSGEQG